MIQTVLMTQTLMDFLQIVAPTTRLTPVSARRSTAEGDALDRARQRMDQRLARLNSQAAVISDTARLIAMPLCPSACAPGTLSEFIFSLNTDPFQRWNMMVYADRPETADLLNTLPYHPDYETDTDAVMIDYLMGLKAKRDADFAADPEMTALQCQTYNTAMRTRLMDDCRQIERALFGPQKRLWQVQDDGVAEATSPPSAAISAAMSSGNGAENRI